MFNNLNSQTIKSILENTCKVSDEKAAKIDEILTDNDLEKIMDKTCPITGEVFEKLKESMANPENLRLTAVKENDEYHLYIECTEFANYCEANELGIPEAADSIIEAYETMVPGVTKDKFHVVFPSNGLEKKLQEDELGLAREDSWSNKLIRGCMQYGLQANVGVDKKDVDKADDDTEEIEID